MPFFVLERYPSDDSQQSVIGPIEIATIFAALPMAVMISVPIIGSKMNSFGRKKMLLLTMGCSVGSTILAASASLFNSSKVFFAVSLFSRHL